MKSRLARVISHYIRNWDIRTSNSVDYFVANSEFIARRIRKVYQRESQVIFPPVDVDAFSMNAFKEDFYLTASRMVPYKKIDLIVEAFARMPGKRLVVIGDGPQMRKMRAKATPNVEIRGYQPFAGLRGGGGKPPCRRRPPTGKYSFSTRAACWAAPSCRCSRS